MTILVAVAEDAAQEAVLDVAVALAKGLDQDLYVVHLVDAATADAEAKRVRDATRERVADANVVVTVALEHVSHSGTRPGNRIGQELVDLAADVDISHIVMGHASKGWLARLREGDTAFAVVADADVPVTIVPNGSETAVDDSL